MQQTSVTSPRLSIGFPKIRKEAGEVRAFLPRFVSTLSRWGAATVLEHGYGEEMGIHMSDYLYAVPELRFGTQAEVYAQDIVIILRCPEDDELRLLQRGACLISMLHFPTRPRRVELLRSLGVEAISMDSLKDDTGRRIVENLKAVGWNGVEVAMRTLAGLYPAPGFENPQRNPIRVTLLGAGAVGGHAMAAAIRYGDEALRRRLANNKVPGVQVTVVDYDLTELHNYMQNLLSLTDLLIDATQRPDPTRPVIPNDWIAWLPEHAVILDLSVDPYEMTADGLAIKGIEGIPQGNLDTYVFAPDSSAYDLIPERVCKRHRRWVVSSYSWPGIHPKECMELYGWQLQPILRTIIEKGGLANINPHGKFFERAIARAQLSRWGLPEHNEK